MHRVSEAVTFGMFVIQAGISVFVPGTSLVYETHSPLCIQNTNMEKAPLLYKPASLWTRTQIFLVSNHLGHPTPACVHRLMYLFVFNISISHIIGLEHDPDGLIASKK